MNRMLLIPVAGTLAALAVVLLAHGENKDFAQKQRDPRPQILQDEGRHTRAPDPERYSIELRADGTYFVAETERSYDSLEQLLPAIAPATLPPPDVTLSVADGVPDALAAQARRKIGERSRLTEPEAEKAPDGPARTYHVNLRETGVFEVIETNSTHATADALLEALAEDSAGTPDIRLFTTSLEVDAKALEEAAAKLRARANVTVKTSGAEAEK